MIVDEVGVNVGEFVEVCSCSAVNGPFTLLSYRPEMRLEVVDEFGGGVVGGGAQKSFGFRTCSQH